MEINMNVNDQPTLNRTESEPFRIAPIVQLIPSVEYKVHTGTYSFQGTYQGTEIRNGLIVLSFLHQYGDGSFATCLIPGSSDLFVKPIKQYKNES
jgi:hypothetical protein